MCLWPSTTPGSVSTSMSRSAACCCCGEVAHLGLREADVVEVALRHLRDRALDLGRRQPEVGRRPLVEFLRQLADRQVAARLDIGQDALDRRADLGIGGLDRARIHSALEPAGHEDTPDVVGLVANSYRRAAPRDTHKTAGFSAYENRWPDHTIGFALGALDP